MYMAFESETEVFEENDTWIDLDVEEDLANQDCSESSDPENKDFEAFGSENTDHSI